MPVDVAWLFERIVRMRVAGGLFALWGVSAYVRCLDRENRRRLVAVALLVCLWMLLVIVKWKLGPAWPSVLLWYGFYIPMTCLPLLCLLCAARATGLDRRAWARPTTWVLWAVAGVIIALVLTNDLHEQVFRFLGEPRNDLGPYAYGPGYWVVIAWSGFCYMGFFAILLAYARRKLKPLFVPPVIVGLAGAAFCAGYMRQSPWAFELNFSLVYCTIVLAVLELCLDFGIIASARSFARLFADLPLDLKVIDRAGNVFRATRVAAPLAEDVRERVRALAQAGRATAEGAAAQVTPQATQTAQAASDRPRTISFSLAAHPDELFRVWQQPGALAVLTQDTTELNALAQALSDRRTALERTNEMLRHRQRVEGLSERLASRQRLTDEVESAISSSLGKVRSILDGLPMGEDDDAGVLRVQGLRKARLLLGYCKRKSSLALFESADPEIEQDRVQLIANELAGDLRAVGIDAAAMVGTSHALPAHEMSVLYDCIYGVAEIAFACERPALMYFLGERADGLVELRAQLQSDDENDLSLHPGTAALRELLATRDVVYALAGGAEELRLIARVRAKARDGA